jgi:3-oxoacyl-[acyl-carrier protein] reductase
LQIKNKTFVITGAAQGLGEAISVALARQGANLALLDINAERLDQTLAACQQEGSSCYAFTCDVADETSVERCFVSIEEHLGPIAGIVNNAGILRDAMLVKVKEGEIVDRMSLEQWQSVIDINLTGVFLCGREAATSMIRSGDGGVIITPRPESPRSAPPGHVNWLDITFVVSPLHRAYSKPKWSRR